MSLSEDANIKEKIKSFLIVGETLDGTFSFEEYQYFNITTAIVLFVSGIYSGIQAVIVGIFWWFLAIGFIIGAFYFFLLYKVNITFAITKFRIIKLENDLISQWFFQSSRLIGFSDLHYEHVESINVGSAKVNMSRFYGSLIGLSFGSLILTQDPLQAANLMSLVAVLLIVASVINIAFSLPLGGVRMRVQSISGEVMAFPEEKTPPDFVDELILNCRTFLSYGAQ